MYVVLTSNMLFVFPEEKVRACNGFLCLVLLLCVFVTALSVSFLCVTRLFLFSFSALVSLNLQSFRMWRVQV